MSAPISQNSKSNEPSASKRYWPVGHYGLIGDFRTVALVTLGGEIDWCCMPRFDSPSVFGALLDVVKGGVFSVKPIQKYVSKQYYEKETSILVTEHSTDAGLVEVLDLMYCSQEEGRPEAGASNEIHRRIRGIEGNTRIQIVFCPRFNYGRNGVSMLPTHQGVSAQTHETNNPSPHLVLAANLDFKVDKAERGVAELDVSREDECWLVASFNPGDPARPVERYESDSKLEQTRKFWSNWVKGCKYSGEYRDQVMRSAITLKLLSYFPTGAIVAAPTTSLPEEIGGVRNWDYRYSWLRDSCFSLWAFYALGHSEEATKYLMWLGGLTSKGRSKHSFSPRVPRRIQIMYGVEGETDLSEE